jgi:DNA-binding NarL/FixJ family response regulator
MTKVLALASDLIFSTRIAATAQAQEVSCNVIGSLNEVPDALSQNPSLAFIDLTTDASIEAIGLIRQHPGTVRIVAFAPHVDTQAIEQARQAGADDVLARSAFVKQLAGLLAGT